jgi:hypothetical protein
MKRMVIFGTLLLSVAGLAAGEELLTLPPARVNYVTAMPVPQVKVAAGRPTRIRLKFRVADGFHINSNKPTSDLLIPTRVSFSVPTDLSVGKVTYPPGHHFVLAIAPQEKLNVYTGEFTVAALVSSTRSAMPGRYKVRGELKYQACNDRACFPPKKVPVDFEVRVLRSRLSTSYRPRRNPPQSPHIHR